MKSILNRTSKIAAFIPLSGRQKRNNVAWIIGLIVILTYSALVNPEESNITTCRFHELTGLDCPACGISRSFYALSHFKFSDAYDYHIFGPVLFLIFLFLLLFFLIELMIRMEIKLSSQFINFKLFSVVFIGLWLTAWILKILT